MEYYFEVGGVLCAVRGHHEDHFLDILRQIWRAAGAWGRGGEGGGGGGGGDIHKGIGHQDINTCNLRHKGHQDQDMTRASSIESLRQCRNIKHQESKDITLCKNSIKKHVRQWQRSPKKLRRQEQDMIFTE